MLFICLFCKVIKVVLLLSDSDGVDYYSCAWGWWWDFDFLIDYNKLIEFSLQYYVCIERGIMFNDAYVSLLLAGDWQTEDCLIIFTSFNC